MKLKPDLKSGTQKLRNIVLTNGKRKIFKDLPCTTQKFWGVVIVSQASGRMQLLIKKTTLSSSSFNLLLWSLYNFQFLQQIKLLHSLMVFTEQFIPRLDPSCVLNNKRKVDHLTKDLALLESMRPNCGYMDCSFKRAIWTAVQVIGSLKYCIHTYKCHVHMEQHCFPFSREPVPNTSPSLRNNDGWSTHTLGVEVMTTRKPRGPCSSSMFVEICDQTTKQVPESTGS